MRPPAPYVDLSSGDARAWLLPEALAWAADILRRDDTIYRSASSHKCVDRLQGRGPTLVLSLPSGDRWVIRHYQRGGRLAPLLGDRYLRVGRPRPMRELASSLRVRDLDLRTPLVVAAVVYARGCFYRGDLVSEHVPDSADLAAYLFRREVNGSAASSAPDRARALAATGRLIRDLAEKGVSHADLNAKNVLLTWPDDCNDPLLHILDLDRCRIRRSPLRDGGVSLLARLVRSLRKLGAASGHPLNETEWSALHAAFQEQP